MNGSHSVFVYQYRDAGNYKILKSVLLRGQAAHFDEDSFQSKLEAGMFFIPEQVNLASLQGEFSEYSQVPTPDDHVWHEFVTIRSANDGDLADLVEAGEIDELLKAFKLVNGWDESASPIYAYLMGSFLTSKAKQAAAEQL